MRGLGSAPPGSAVDSVPPLTMFRAALSLSLLSVLASLAASQPAPGSCDGQGGNKECFQNFNFVFTECQCNFECTQFIQFTSGCCADFFDV